MRRLTGRSPAIARLGFPGLPGVLVMGLLWGTPLFAGSASFNYFTTQIDVTPTGASTGWRDVDVSANVPPGATGVLLLYRNTGADENYGVRTKGSTDGFFVNGAKSGQLGYQMVGLDATLVFQVYKPTPAITTNTFLLGYTMSGVTFFTNRPTKSIAITSAWTDVGIAADTGSDTAIGAIFLVHDTSTTSYQYGLRKKTSTDPRTSIMRPEAIDLAVIGVDASETAQMWIQNQAVDLYLVGYVTSGAVFFTNGVDKSTGITGSYVDVDITGNINPGDDANGAIVEINLSPPTGPRRAIALRPKGAAYNYYNVATDSTHSFPLVGIDGANVFQQQIESTTNDLFLIGYTLVSDCCQLTTSSAGTKITVDTPDVKMVWDAAGNAGGGLNELYVNQEANPAVNRSGNVSWYNLFSTQVNDGGAWQFEGFDNATGLPKTGAVTPLEVTATRVKLRQNYDYTTAVHLQRDWAAYGYPRLGIRETLTFDDTQSRRGATGISGKGENPCAGNTFFCAVASNPTDKVFIVSDDASTYSDMLAIPYLPPDPFFSRTASPWTSAWELGSPNTWFARTWESAAQATGPGSFTNFYEFYPALAGITSSGTEWQPYANDYRAPAVLTINGGSGSQWADAAESTSGASDFFNEAEAAYVLELNPSLGLDFNISGGAVNRKTPFFKVRQWRSLADPASVTLDGVPLTNGLGFNADVKPISRAYFCTTAGCGASTQLASGGLVGAATEYLADGGAAKNYAFNLAGVTVQHLYLGSDSKFRGLNVTLATVGVGTADLQWEYWNGGSWMSLEGVPGFVDQTSSLKRNGTISWTSDPNGWSPTTPVSGGPSLYYVRATLASGSYSTFPIESQIRTDILLFQYCGDVTANSRFVFAPPAPVATYVSNLTVVKTDGQTTAAPGAPITYTITVTNNGPNSAMGVNLIDSVPTDILGGLFNTSNGLYNNGTSIWTFAAPLLSAQSAILTLTGTISLTATGNLVNTATVTPEPGTTDPVLPNISVDTDTLSPRTDLEVMKSAPPMAALADTIVYSLTARNNGPSNATGVTLVDDLPAEVAFVSSVPAGPACTYNGGFHRVTCDVGAQGPGATFPVSITVQVIATGPITNRASVYGNEIDPNSANNTVTVGTHVPSDPCLGDDTGAWWNTDWRRRREITFDNSAQASSLVDFPVLVKLDGIRVDYSRTRDQGQDIRFVDADGSTVLAHEIELWNETGTSYVWVRAPQIDGGSNTDSIWLYYDNPSAPDGQNVPGVWDAGFKMVQHLNECCGAGAHTDSATADGAANDSIGAQVSIQGGAGIGQIDGADLLVEGSGDYVEVADHATLDAGPAESLTVEAWVRPSTIGGYQHVVSKEPNGSDTDGGFEFVVIDGTASFAVADTVANPDETCRANSTITLAPGVWYYLVGRYDRSSDACAVFVNGMMEGVNNNGAIGSLANIQPLGLGEESDGTPGYYFDGRMDEVRLAKVARSPDWIRAQYLSMNDAFARFSGEAGTCHLRSIGTRPSYGTAEVDGFGSTVAVNSGALRTVIGSGTAFRAANRGRGDRITIEGTDYTIARVDSDTQLTLTAPFVAAPGAGKSYAVARKFATLGDWESCIDGLAPPPLATCEGGVSDSLVADARGEVGIAYNDTGHPVYPFAGGLIIDGRPDNQNTDPSHAITLTADDGNRHLGRPGTGVVVDNTGGTSPAVEIRDNFVTVEWLEVTGGAAALDGIVVDGVTPATKVVVAANLIHDLPGGDGIEVRDDDAVVDLVNNVVYGINGVGVSLAAPALTGASRIRALNNTLYDNALGGIVGSAGPYPTVLLQNNLAVGNPGSGDFSVPGFDPASSHNLGSDGSGVSHSQGGTGVDSTVLNVQFVNEAAGDLHILGASTAANAGTPLSTFFTFDIDRGTRQTPWDIGADDVVAPSANLALTKDDGRTTAAPGGTVTYTITVTNNGPDAVASVTVIDTIPPEIVLPSVSWNTANGTYVPGTNLWTFASPLLTGQSADLTLSGIIDISATGDVFNTASVSPPAGTTDPFPGNNSDDDLDPLMPEADLEVTKSGNPNPVPVDGLLTYSLDVINHGPSNSSGGTITDPLPPGVDFVSASPGCTYFPPSRTVSCTFGALPLLGTTGFSVVVTPRSAGLITNIASVLGSDTDPFSGNDSAEATTTVSVPSDAVQFFTVTSTSGENFLEWKNPSIGAAYITTHIRYNAVPGSSACVFPSSATAGTGLPVAPGTEGAYDSYPHGPLPNDNTTYCYAAFVEKQPGSMYSAGRYTKGRPFGLPYDASPARPKWAFSTGATAMAPPGIGTAAAYAVSNDRVLYGIVRGSGATSGRWLSGWTPLALNEPVQSRPPSVPTTEVPGATQVVFLGSQDGKVYAANALSGGPGPLWSSGALGTRVQAAAAGMFTSLGGPYNYVLVGSWNSSGGNTFYALRVDDGTVWGTAFDNLSGGDGTGGIGIISGGAAVDYPGRKVYFASRRLGGGSQNALWCLNLTPGGLTFAWAKDLSEDVDGSPVLRGGRVYVGTNSGKVIGVDASDGGNQWTFATGDGPVKGFVFPDRSGTSLYVATTNKVWGLTDGAPTANWPAVSIPNPSMVLFIRNTPYVYAGSSDGRLYELDMSLAGPVTSPSVDSVVLGDGMAGVGAPTLDTINDLIYVGSEAGVVYAVQVPLP